METFLEILALVLALIGLLGCILPGLPGTLFSFVALLCSYGCGWSLITPRLLWIWGAVSVVVMVMDYLLPGYMTKLFGGSRASAVGATVGLFAGLIFTPIGMILGSFLGAVIGEMIHDNSSTTRALKAGVGSFLAFITGTGLKLLTSLWMTFYVVRDLWLPIKELF